MIVKLKPNVDLILFGSSGKYDREIIKVEIGEDNPLTKHLLHSILILETNLGIELYSDGGEL